jgi:hypothetical protein
MAIKRPLVLDHFGEEMYQTNVYLYGHYCRLLRHLQAQEKEKCLRMVFYGRNM